MKWKIENIINLLIRYSKIIVSKIKNISKYKNGIDIL